ncbi:MAG TPA: DinB family protein [Actinomycetota bacterium]|nr:DinB family protein [Actinomycetota bacterium]
MSEVPDARDGVAVADERATYDAFLDFFRDAIVRKVRDVSEDDARRRLVPSATTLAGIVKHLARVETSWFHHRLAQIPREELPLLRLLDEPDADFAVGPEETVEGLLALYDEQCARSRELAARYELDHVVPHPHHGRVSLRWIYVHMIEETARHAGHADILRELIDGSTGD